MSYEYCDETSVEGRAEHCPSVLEIETQSSYTYECTQSPMALTTQTCDKNLVIEVIQPQQVTNFTPGAALRRSTVQVPSRFTPEGFVNSPTLLPLKSR